MKRKHRKPLKISNQTTTATTAIQEFSNDSKIVIVKADDVPRKIYSPSARPNPYKLQLK